MPVPSHLFTALEAAAQSLVTATPQAFDSAQVHLSQVVQALTDQPELRRDPAVLRSLRTINLLSEQAARLRMSRRNWSIEA
jgi:hypothetical protein